MDGKRAQEILDQINGSRWGWQGETDKFFRDGERQEVIEYWNTMPGYTCFADALHRMAEMEGL